MARLRHTVPPTWMALGHRLAVIAAAACGLLSLLLDAPPIVAATRGGLAWLAVVVYFRVARRALTWRHRQEAAERRKLEREAAAAAVEGE